MAQEEEMKLIKLFKEKIMVGRSLHTRKLWIKNSTKDYKKAIKITDLKNQFILCSLNWYISNN